MWKRQTDRQCRGRMTRAVTMLPKILFAQKKKRQQWLSSLNKSLYFLKKFLTSPTARRRSYWPEEFLHKVQEILHALSASAVYAFPVSFSSATPDLRNATSDCEMRIHFPPFHQAEVKLFSFLSPFPATRSGRQYFALTHSGL